MNKTNEVLEKFFAGFEDTFIWSLKKVNNDEIINYSDNIVKITGYTSEETKSFPGRGLALVSEEDLQKIKKSYADFVNDPLKNFVRLVYRIVRKDKKGSLDTGKYCS